MPCSLISLSCSMYTTGSVTEYGVNLGIGFFLRISLRSSGSWYARNIFPAPPANRGRRVPGRAVILRSFEDSTWSKINRWDPPHIPRKTSSLSSTLSFSRYGRANSTRGILTDASSAIFLVVNPQVYFRVIGSRNTHPVSSRAASIPCVVDLANFSLDAISLIPGFSLSVSIIFKTRIAFETIGAE